MILAKKVRLYPTKEQEQQMWKSAGTKRFIYNWTLAKQQDNYKNGGKFIKDGDLRKELTQLKKTEELKWLNEVSNNVTKQAVKDACESYNRFFKKKSSVPQATSATFTPFGVSIEHSVMTLPVLLARKKKAISTCKNPC